jgi:hypothetical protein
MTIILNEKEKAVEYLITGYIDYKKPTDTIRILIKYFYSKGMDKSQIRDEIENYMVKNYLDFNSASWQNTLDNMVKTYSKEKFNLIAVDSINITQGEWNTIRSVGNIKFERLLFVLLVYAKVLNKINDKNNNWVNKEINTIFKAAKLTETGKQQRLILKQLSDLEYLQIPKMVNGTSVRVGFIDDNSKVLFELKDFENIILSYFMLKGENIKVCEGDGCNNLIKVTTSNNKYCPNCSKEINRIKTLENWHKNKSKNFEATNPDKC